MRLTQKLVLFAFIAAFAHSEHIYQGLDSSVMRLSAGNWASQVVKARSNEEVVIIHFFKDSAHGDSKSYDFSAGFKERSTKMKGILKMGGVDCVADAQLCEKEGITQFPTVKIYPPVPIPAFIPEKAGLEIKKIVAWAAGYVPSNVKEVTDDNINGIVNSNPSVPKVFLFSKKDKAPLLWKAISNAFKEKLFIGLVNDKQSDVAYKFNVKSYPKIIVKRTSDKRPTVYDGKFNFQSIFDFLNVFSEQFVPGGGSSADGPGDKPWLNEAVPELFAQSADDVCLGHKKTLCVILFEKGQPSKETIGVLKEIRRDYDNKLERGFSFKFMWADYTKQTEWVSAMSIESAPTLVVLNPGRRKRYLKNPGQPSIESVNKQLEAILGGDSRFTPLRPNEIPKLL